MEKHEYRALTRGVGEVLRGVYGAAVRPGMTRSAIAAQLTAGGITDEDVQARIIERAVRLAERTKSMHRRTAQQTADAIALGELRQIIGADSLAGDDRLPNEPDKELRSTAKGIGEAIPRHDRIDIGARGTLEFEDDTGKRRTVVIP